MKEINPCHARSFSDASKASFAGFNILSWIMESGFLWGEPDKNLSSPERTGFHSSATVWFSFHWRFWLLRRNVSTWLTVLPAPCFQVRLEYFSPSSTLKLELNGWFDLQLVNDSVLILYFIKLRRTKFLKVYSWPSSPSETLTASFVDLFVLPGTAIATSVIYNVTIVRLNKTSLFPLLK